MLLVGSRLNCILRIVDKRVGLCEASETNLFGTRQTTVPTAILSRQMAGTRDKTLIVNLPGKPASIDLCLGTVFPAVPYCLDLIGAGRIETDPAVVAAFRP